MPRTKQLRKKSSMVKKQQSKRVTNVPIASRASSAKESVTNLIANEYESYDEFLKEFDTYYNNKVQEYQQGYQNAVEHVKKMFSDILNTLPPELNNLNSNKNDNEFNAQDQNKDPNITTHSARKSRSQRPAQLSEFKKPKTPRVVSRSSSRKRSLSAFAIPAPHTDGYKTPLMSNRTIAPGSTITPKIYSNTPIAMMRRPLHGEVAISMSGSPLMVGAVSREDIPTVNVPMQDGRVFSIMPEPGAPPPDLPDFDETTKNYLKTLRAHLEILAPNTP